MKLIFTSYTGVYVLDIETRDLRPIHKGSGMYYGLTWLDNKMYVAARNSVSDYRLGEEKILVFNKDLKQIGELKPALKNCGLHSILVLPNHQLWITCSLKNKIARFDLITKKRLLDYYPDPNKKDSDFNHFNALTLDQSTENVLINVHNQGRKCSEVWECFIKNMAIIKKVEMPGSSHSHCCWREGDTFWTCASEESQVKSDKNENMLPQKLSGYTRGVVLTKNRLIVGESQRAVREQRATTGGLIHIYDRGSLRKITTYKWPKIGQVAEIRALDAVDEHHWPEPFWSDR